jgi:hypothetical protein
MRRFMVGDADPLDGRSMAGLASRVAPERDVLRGEALRVTAAVRGARWHWT